MKELSHLKYKPLSASQIDELAFDVIMGLKRPCVIAENSYLHAEEEFGQVDEDPYIAICYDSKNDEHVSTVKQSSIHKNIGIIAKYADGSSLEPKERSFFYDGYGYVGEHGDFLIEALYPLAAYIYAKDAFQDNEYMTDYSNAADTLRLLLFKFLTRFMMDGHEFDHFFGLDKRLGIPFDGFTFRQLAIMLGFETERTARGLALASTPKTKRIEVFKADGNRTLIERDVFINYVNNYNKTRTIEQKDNGLSVEIKLTGGNIRNNHIYLTKVMSLFPECFIGGSKKAELAPSTLKLDVGNDKIFETDIAGDKKIFRSREALKTFFQQNDVGEGDYVVLSTEAKGIYKLRPKS